MLGQNLSTKQELSLATTARVVKSFVITTSTLSLTMPIGGDCHDLVSSTQLNTIVSSLAITQAYC